MPLPFGMTAPALMGLVACKSGGPVELVRLVGVDHSLQQLGHQHQMGALFFGGIALGDEVVGELLEALLVGSQNAVERRQ